jgi:hypothetical protein
MKIRNLERKEAERNIKNWERSGKKIIRNEERKWGEGVKEEVEKRKGGCSKYFSPGSN